MSNKKVLVITYYWPPSGGSGVQRWLKFVKYLPAFGWMPTVVSPETPSVGVTDSSLLNDIPKEITEIKLPIWEPYDLFFKLSRLFGKKEIKSSDFISTGKKSGFQRVSTWIRGNFFIPDARIYWVKPSVRFLNDYLSTHEINTIITTGPPHSVHLIGLGLKKLNPSLRWIADFRDPWSEWDLLDTLSLTAASRRTHKQLERDVLTKADRVITIATYHVERLKVLGDRAVDLITNGFDDDDFSGIQKTRTKKFTIGHVGVVDELRDPRPAMEALRELCSDDPEFANQVAVKFIGNVNSAFREFVKSDKVLSRVIEFVDHLPHVELLHLYGECDLQLLVLAYTAIAPGNLPGKFFEYLASGNPILALGPVDGDAAHVLNSTQAGEIFDRADEPGIKGYLSRQYRRWKQGELGQTGNIEAFTRRNLTKQLVKLLES